MDRKIRRQSKEGVGIPLARLIEGFAKGVAGLLGFAANLEAQGKDEYVEEGEITGKTKSGKEYKGAYGFRVKVGLNPEDFSAIGGSPPKEDGPQAHALGGKGRKKLSNHVDDNT